MSNILIMSLVVYSPTLDPDLTLPEAESLRNVLKEIDGDMEKIHKEREAHQADLAFDYGPDRAFYVLKDQCMEKQIEVRPAVSLFVEAGT
jgi:hypothetical protein